METEYKRDVNHSYLIINSEKEQDTASYQIRMLMGNVISSLLPCTMKGFNGNILFYYDITGRQSVASLYERQKLDYAALQMMLKGIVTGLGQMGEYLLNPDDLILLPEHMYLDMENEQVYLCYLPGYQKDIRQQFGSFSEYFLPKIEHKDNLAVSLGYGIYRLAMADELQIDKMKEEIYQVRELIPEEMSLSVEEEQRNSEELWINREEMLRREAMNAFFGEEEPVPEAGLWKKWAAGGMGILGSIGIGAGVWLGILPWWTGAIIWVMTAVLLGMGILLWRRRKNRHMEGESPKNQQESSDSVLKECEEEWKDHQRGRDKCEKSKKDRSMETTVLFQAEKPAASSLVSKIPGQYPTIFLEQEMVVIGKLPKASDVIIETSTISRVHARICKKEGDYFLADLNSRNGTCVNGKLLQGEEEYCLQNYDEVSFADAQYVFIK